MLETERLILRRFREGDRDAFAAMNADPAVMEHFPATLSREQSDALIDRTEDMWRRDGFSFAAMERRSDGSFLGMAGIARVDFDAPFCPNVEIGWRLPISYWGRGYASEAARAWLRHGFDELGLDEIVSFTATKNLRSQAVMQRIGMHHDPERDFEHPELPSGHRLRRHVLYALRRDAWRSQAAGSVR